MIEYEEDELGAQLKQLLNSKNESLKWNGLVFRKENLKCWNNLLKYEGRVLVPKAWREIHVKWIHEENSSTAHQRVQRTLYYLKQNFCWPYTNEFVSTQVWN